MGPTGIRIGRKAMNNNNNNKLKCNFIYYKPKLIKIIDVFIKDTILKLN